MNPNQILKRILAAAATIALTVSFAGPATGKSLYVNRDANANSPIRAYDIQGPPNYLVQQADSNATRFGGVGLAIDTDSETLFVTFEASGTLDIVDATTLQVGVSQVTAPGASNLAGIVVDQDLERVYTVDRGTDNLYVYDWDASTTTLALDAQIDLPGLINSGTGGAYGIALDEVNDLLYVTSATNIVRYYATSDFTTLAGSFALQNAAIGIAVDVQNQFLYTGAAFVGNFNLSQYDLVNSTEATVFLGNGVGVQGGAVDPDTGLLYITTGFAEDAIRVYDTSLALLHTVPSIGGAPTGIVVPGKDISFNPLNLAKDDGLDFDLGECVNAGQDLTYTISFDNSANAFPVNNVSLVDLLPLEAAFVSATGGGTYDASTHTVSWDLPNLPASDPGATLELVVNVDPSLAVPGGTMTNTCTISSDETPPTTKNEQTLICLCPPPEVTCSVMRDLLWPPNHKMMDVGLSFTADSACGGEIIVTATVYADEDDEEPTGDGHHSPDSLDDGETLRLRSERNGEMDGRVYLIVLEATDERGNVASDCCTVVVPRSPNKKGVAMVDAQAAAAEATWAATGAAPAAFVLVGDGEIIGPKQ